MCSTSFKLYIVKLYEVLHVYGNIFWKKEDVKYISVNMVYCVLFGLCFVVWL